MTQNVQDLIDKIKSEGIQAAEEKARQIEEQAQKEAQKIITEAEAKRKAMMLEANEEIKRLKESTEMALQQSSRDTLLTLRKEIEKTLKKIISKEVSSVLTADNLAGILGDVIKNYAGKRDEAGIEVALNSKDLEKLRNGFVTKLQKELKSEIRLQASHDLGKGFTISFDQGKSSFDFSDESLAEYLSTYLNSQVSTIVQDSVKK